MTIAEYFELRGFRKGFEESFSRSRLEVQLETKKEIAQKLLQMKGMSIEYVAQVTDLSLKDFELLINSSSH
jgi:hypothetical protein